jgi:ribosome-associated translation inhibitor RaiA
MFSESPSLRIELVTQGCELSASEIADMQDDLDTLRRIIEHFPSSTLHISISFHQRNKTYHVKTSLSLCGTTLFTGDRDLASHPAFERCIHKLVSKVQSHKAKMAGKIDWNKATSGNHAELNPTDQFDALELD